MPGWMRSDRLGVERVCGPVCAAVLISKGQIGLDRNMAVTSHLIQGKEEVLGGSWKEGVIKCLFPFYNLGNIKV